MSFSVKLILVNILNSGGIVLKKSFGIILLGTFLVLSACGATTETTGSTTPGPTTEAPATEAPAAETPVAEPATEEVPAEAPAAEEPAKEEAPAEQTYGIGDAAVAGDMQLTVTEVEKSLGAEFEKPKAGNEYVIVHLKIENVGEANLSYNPFYFKLLNSKGQLVDGTFSMINTDTALQAGELTAAGNVEGSLIFEAPKDDAGLQLQYEPMSFLETETLKIDLK